MHCIRFSGQFTSHDFCETPRFFRARKKENLFFFAHVRQKAERFLLPFFVKADENIIENERHRLDLVRKGHSQTDANGQVNLIAQPAAPLLFRDTPLHAVYGKELAPVKGSLQGIPAARHEGLNPLVTWFIRRGVQRPVAITIVVVVMLKPSSRGPVWGAG